MNRFLAPIFSSPLLRRVGWHIGRVRSAVDRRFFIQLLGAAFVESPRTKYTPSPAGFLSRSARTTTFTW